MLATPSLRGTQILNLTCVFLMTIYYVIFRPDKYRTQPRCMLCNPYRDMSCASMHDIISDCIRGAADRGHIMRIFNILKISSIDTLCMHDLYLAMHIFELLLFNLSVSISRIVLKEKICTYFMTSFCVRMSYIHIAYQYSETSHIELLSSRITCFY